VKEDQLLVAGEVLPDPVEIPGHAVHVVKHRLISRNCAGKSTVRGSIGVADRNAICRNPVLSPIAEPAIVAKFSVGDQAGQVARPSRIRLLDGRNLRQIPRSVSSCRRRRPCTAVTGRYAERDTPGRSHDAVFHAIESVAAWTTLRKAPRLCRRQRTDLSCLIHFCCQTRHVRAATLSSLWPHTPGGADDSIVVAKEVSRRDGCIFPPFEQQ